MTITSIDWNALQTSEASEKKAKIFAIMQQVSYELQSGVEDDPEILSVVPRLADIIYGSEDLNDLYEPYSAMARATGLWNYIDKERADPYDRLVSEAVTAISLDGITFHREQIAALNTLLAGRNLILSAPTSFGKSLIIDALIATNKYKRIAIVLPTIALLDEFRRRLKRRFGRDYAIVMHHSEVPENERVIYLGTQERLISRPDLQNIDLTVVDEFYKLDPHREDERSATLNAAVYKLLHRSRQFFFLGPNIDNVSTPHEGRWNFEFLKTRFSTVAVDTMDLSKSDDKEKELFDSLGEEKFWPALVFVSSPDRANNLSQQAAELMAVSERSDQFADWLRSNVGEKYPLAKSVEYGFGVHHGRLPRAIGNKMVSLFNTNDLPVLFCTSTLIEGVNTAAKSVFIFDKHINRSPYDFFTFSNIKGRAGRLGQHHVGKVIMFNSAPEIAEMNVAPTLFHDEEDAPDDYVVHLEDEDISSSVDERLEVIKSSLGLEGEELRLASTVGLEVAADIRSKVRQRLGRNSDLLWSGRGDYSEIQAVSELICSVKTPRSFGAFSAKQLTYFIHSLRAQPLLRQFLLNYDSSFKGDATAYDNIFKFLRSCEYGLPQLISVIEMFVRKISQYDVNYSLFVAELPRWFRPELLRNLDEEGYPIQILERFYRNGDNRETLLYRLRDATFQSDLLNTFEKNWMSELLEDEF